MFSFRRIRLRRIAVAGAALALLAGAGEAAAAPQGYSSVGADRVLRIATTGYTAYDYAIGWGNGQWSALGRVRVVNYGGYLPPSTPPAAVMLGIQDYYGGADGRRAYYQKTWSDTILDELRFNDYYMSRSTVALNQGTGAHEFGHALGLAHTATLPDLMYQGGPVAGRCHVPCSGDIAVYNQIYPLAALRAPAPASARPGESVVESEYDFDVESLPALRAQAENVIVARVQRATGTDRSELRPDGTGGIVKSENGLTHTSFSVRVLRAAKGKLSGTAIVRQLGGIDSASGERVTDAHDEPLKPGATYVLFTYRDRATGRQTVLAPGHGNVEVTSLTQADAVLEATR